MEARAGIESGQRRRPRQLTIGGFMGHLEADIDYAIRVHNQALVKADIAFAEVRAEIDKAMRKFPTWPTDPLHAVAVLGEEYGELTKAMLQQTYEPQKTSREEIKKEAVQTAAMAIRLLMSLEAYDYCRAAQHDQGQ